MLRHMWLLPRARRCMEKLRERDGSRTGWRKAPFLRLRAHNNTDTIHA